MWPDSPKTRRETAPPTRNLPFLNIQFRTPSLRKSELALTYNLAPPDPKPQSKTAGAQKILEKCRQTQRTQQQRCCAQATLLHLGA